MHLAPTVMYCALTCYCPHTLAPLHWACIRCAAPFACAGAAWTPLSRWSPLRAPPSPWTLCASRASRRTTAACSTCAARTTGGHVSDKYVCTALHRCRHRTFGMFKGTRRVLMHGQDMSSEWAMPLSNERSYGCALAGCGARQGSGGGAAVGGHPLRHGDGRRHGDVQVS